MGYPRLNGFHVAMDGTCGLGHRLHRNAQIFHSARSAGYAVGVTWFPWSELFDDAPDLFWAPTRPSPSFCFGNEASEIAPVFLLGGEPDITIYKDLAIPRRLNFDYAGCPNELRWHKEMFGPAATDHVADFHFRLVLQLRSFGAERIDRFLAEKVGNKRLVAIHLRTGNGESGDFVEKKRMVRAAEIMARLGQELKRFPRGETVVVVASDSTEPSEILRAETGHEIQVFTETLPRSGFVTGDWVAPNSSEDVAGQSREDRVEPLFEAYADLLLLGMADDLYVGAWSSFLAGPCLMNRRRADLGTTLTIHDAKAHCWRPV